MGKKKESNVTVTVYGIAYSEFAKLKWQQFLRGFSLAVALLVLIVLALALGGKLPREMPLTVILVLVLAVLVPAAFNLFTALLGVVVNLHFPKFDYINETVVIKQSMSTMICMFGSMAVVLVLALLYALLLSASVAPTLFLAVCLVLLVIVCVLMWRYLGHGGSARFAALQAD